MGPCRIGIQASLVVAFDKLITRRIYTVLGAKLGWMDCFCTVKSQFFPPLKMKAGKEKGDGGVHWEWAP